MQRCTDPLTAYILDSFPHKKPQRRWNCIKEGEIAYRPVSRFTACVCAFFLGANSSACKRSADRDPVLHNSQFVDVQIKLTAEYAQALFFVKAFAWQLFFFKRKKIQAHLGLQLMEETRNPFWCLGGSQTWMNGSVDLHFSHTDEGCMSFSLLWYREQAVVSCLKIKTDFLRRLTISWFKKHAKIPPTIQDLGNLPSI